MDDPKPIKLQAYKISCGHAVLKPDEVNKKNLYIKAERKGADYIHHYLIQIGFFKTNNLSLIYIDPEESLIDRGYIPTFALSSSKTYKKPEIGHIFENNNGTFLKVIETIRSQKMFAFIDIYSGEVRRRQERKITQVYDCWEIISVT